MDRTPAWAQDFYSTVFSLQQQPEGNQDYKDYTKHYKKVF